MGLKMYVDEYNDNKYSDTTGFMGFVGMLLSIYAWGLVNVWVFVLTLCFLDIITDYDSHFSNMFALGVCPFDALIVSLIVIAFNLAGVIWYFEPGKRVKRFLVGEIIAIVFVLVYIRFYGPWDAVRAEYLYYHELCPDRLFEWG